MAPFQGPSREQLIELLRANPNQSITLGKYEPQAVVVHEAAWRIQLLEEDPELVREVQERQRAEGYLMPEHYFSCNRPGRILIEADELDDFIRLIERMDWPFGP